MNGEFRIRFEADTPEEEMMQIAALGEGLVMANLWWMRAQAAKGKTFPTCLGCAGIKYEDPPKCSTWCQFGDVAPVIFRRGVATCWSIAGYDAALRRYRGERAEVFVVPFIDEYDQAVPHWWHVLTNDGAQKFDPTLDLIEGRCEGGCREVA